jgi:hypothetical protein
LIRPTASLRTSAFTASGKETYLLPSAILSPLR